MRYQPEELFRSTAPYYARFRAHYPSDLFVFLADRFKLDGSQRVLDLGCGTGQLAVPIAGLVSEVVAVDPDEMMLAEGRRFANGRGVENIEWRLGDSYGLADLEIGLLHLTVMGASFHWMDRNAVLRTLAEMTWPGGGVVVVSGGALGSREMPPWEAVIAAVRERWLGPTRRAGSGTYTHPREQHEDVLRRSPFSDVETVTWTRRVTRDLDSLVGLQFSYSYSAPALLGDNVDAFEADLRAALTSLEPSGTFAEEVRTEVIVAVRP